jgi:predicted 3-demethylubiquinone-9 3-methyltransferase (glyoxalase superfamily)
MRSLTPFLWFDDNLEEAVEFYISVFPDTRLLEATRAPDGKWFTAEFELAGQRVQGLNGGPHFRFNESFSFFVVCDDQQEVDRFWAALTRDGGEESQCGWCKDRFGLSWQIVPVAFVEMTSGGTPDQIQAVMAAMMTMSKMDVAALRAAYEGAA